MIRTKNSQIPTSGITKASPARTREYVEPEELRPLEVNPDDGEPPENGIHGLTPPQPIMDRMPLGISTPKELSWANVGMDVARQSTPATLLRGPQQAGQMTFRKPKVTFATTPFKEKEAVRAFQNEATPRNGTQRRTIFEDDLFGTNGAWKRTPVKDSDKHSGLVEVRS